MGTQTTVLHSLNNAFEAYIAQICVVIILLVLASQKVAFNVRYIEEDRGQAPNRTLGDRVSAAMRGASSIKAVAVVQTVNGLFHIVVAVVQVTRRLLLAFNDLNFCSAVGVLQTLLVALQSIRQFARKNINKQMRKNSRSGIEKCLADLGSLRKTSEMLSDNVTSAGARNANRFLQCIPFIAVRQSFTRAPRSFLKPDPAENATAYLPESYMSCVVVSADGLWASDNVPTVPTLQQILSTKRARLRCWLHNSVLRLCSDLDVTTAMRVMSWTSSSRFGHNSSR